MRDKLIPYIMYVRNTEGNARLYLEFEINWQRYWEMRNKRNRRGDIRYSKIIYNLRDL